MKRSTLSEADHIDHDLAFDARRIGPREDDDAFGPEQRRQVGGNRPEHAFTQRLGPPVELGDLHLHATACHDIGPLQVAR